MRCACIDVGSNTTRLLVAEHDDAGRLRDVHAERVFSRLGHGRAADGAIPAAKIAAEARTIAAHVATARAHGAVHINAVATAAVRAAPNGEELCAAVRAAAGVPLRILTPQEEAHLAFAGATRGLAAAAAGLPVAVVDVGGGSTELVTGVRGGGTGEVRWWTSLPVGSGVLAERFFAGDPPAAEELAASRAHVEAVFAEVELPPVAVALGAGGSAASLARVVGPELSVAALERALALLVAEPSGAVAARTGLAPERVRVLPGGLLVLCAVAARLGPVTLRIGGGGLREGVLDAMLRGTFS